MEKLKIATGISGIFQGTTFRVLAGMPSYIPITIEMEGLQESLACGSHLKNTICIAKGNIAYLTSHIGDLSNYDIYKKFISKIEYFKKVYNINPGLIAHDLHPDYLSTIYAYEQAGVKVGVQHHHAHIVSCMVENNLSEKVIGIAFDGTGLGTDGNIWGGEFLLCDYQNFHRAAHLNYIRMPGGEKAVQEPWRMAVSYLYSINRFKYEYFKGIDICKLKTVIKMIENQINSPLTSSMGRLFDGIAALIGLRQEISYVAQAAIELETTADIAERGVYRYRIERENGVYLINVNGTIEDILMDIGNQVTCNIIAGRFHNTVIAFTVEMCGLLRDQYGISATVLSGGVFQNDIIFKGIHNGLLNQGFQVYTHEKIPCDDGGLSIGQLVIANRKTRGNL